MFAFQRGARSLVARAKYSSITSNGRNHHAGRSQSGCRFGSVFLVVLWLVALIAPPASFAADPSAVSTATVPTVGTACPSVVFIGARGSGERDAYNVKDAAGKTIRKDSGLGPELDAVYDQMSGYLTARNVSVKSLFVVYPASNVNVLFLSKKEQTVLAALLLTGPSAGLAVFAASYVVNHVNVYLASIDEGVKSATDELTTEAAQCPNARFVLGGYSQGALVMHELLLRLSDKNDASSQGLLGRITATVLIADPGRKSNTAAMHYGTADPGAQGIKSFFTVGERDVPTPSSTYDVCNLGDMVCDFSWATIVDKTSTTAGFNVHTLSYQKNPMGVGSTIAATLMQQLSGATVLTGVRKITADSGSAYALKEDGTVWSWGYNDEGQLGIGTTDPSAVPVQVTGLTNVINVSADNSVYAVRSDGTVWSWGGTNTFGQLGNGTPFIGSFVPAQIKGLTGVRSIAVGRFGYSICALKTDGTVWCWGHNDHGQLGNGANVDSPAPVQVVGLTGVESITAGNGSVDALKADGTVWSWGQNDHGQLGNGGTTDSASPVQVAGLAGVQSITAGDGSAYAITADRTLWSWGINTVGQLGNGGTIDSAVPVQVAALSGVQNVVVELSPDPGNYSAYALKTDGTVWSWGANNVGQLGNGNSINSALPVQVTGLAGVRSVSAAAWSVHALKADGTVWSWGYNNHGQLGNGTTTDSVVTTGSAVPVQAIGLTGVQSVAVGGWSAYALTAGGTAWSWGSNPVGQLGNGTTTDRTVPTQVK
ncbi:cutinase family protein [Pseudarthrobacter sp. AG30]|uniref:RCC1 domain-containing protein n=1 Tax=Pseudarthrobacter sp. AG30 TaxID=2249742 RepID=UPI000D6546E4|nr:cutinase family protein [Pseudarthrobacter sp. AG30]RAX16739.1 cutinase family protein [Pseudarthrobacter sp. AG30]